MEWPETGVLTRFRMRSGKYMHAGIWLFANIFVLTDGRRSKGLCVALVVLILNILYGFLEVLYFGKSLYISFIAQC